MNFYVAAPKYGFNYARGWIGFTRVTGVVSDAIAFGERRERNPMLPEVTHALIVTGADECVEAQLGQGVIKTTLSKYFNRADRIFFRQPVPWTMALGERIAAEAESKVGFGYNNLLIAEQAACDSLAGQEVNHWFQTAPHILLAKLLDKPGAFICSQLASYCLTRQRELGTRGVLANPVDTISPQELFGDCDIFAPFINEIS